VNGDGDGGREVLADLVEGTAGVAPLVVLAGGTNDQRSVGGDFQLGG